MWLSKVIFICIDGGYIYILVLYFHRLLVCIRLMEDGSFPRSILCTTNHLSIIFKTFLYIRPGVLALRLLLFLCLKIHFIINLFHAFCCLLMFDNATCLLLVEPNNILFLSKLSPINLDKN